MNIALSTSWFPHLDLSLDDFLQVMKLFGVTRFELNYRVHPLDLELWRSMMDKHQLTITSLHNICSMDTAPLAPGNHYGDDLAHLDDAVRRQSVGQLRGTAEAAVALGAQAIVVHAGHHAGHYRHPDYTALIEELRHNSSGDRLSALQERVAALASDRDATAQPYLDQLVKSLRETVFDFPTIRFGLENRYHYYGLPRIHELESVLERVGAQNVGLWADLGHGQVQENLGLIPGHELWFERYDDHLFGIHLHGLRGAIDDHYAPTADNMDWGMVRRHVGPDTLLVAELAAQANSLGTVLAGMRYLDAFLGVGS